MTPDPRIGVCFRCATLSRALGFATWAVAVDRALACTVCHDHPVAVLTEKRARLDIAGALLDPAFGTLERR